MNLAAKGDVSQLVDVNDIAEEVDEPQAPLRRMHKLPAKTTTANYHKLIYANGENISFLHVPELAEMIAPILRSRLNLYRMLMIIAVLRRYEELGTVEGMFGEKRFAIAEADLKWGLAYIFYCMMQTSTIYDRLRPEEREEPKVVRISPLAFLQRLPRNFTRAMADSVGEELGIKARAVTHHLQTLCRKGCIVRVRQGVYSKAARTIKKYRNAS